jgi:hypothetical protein
LQAIDRSKDAAIISMHQNAAGKPDTKDSKAAFSALSKLQDALSDTFGGINSPTYQRLQSALARFEAAVDPADGLSHNAAATAASIDDDLKEIASARNELRRHVLLIAEKHPLFALYGRHAAIG